MLEGRPHPLRTARLVVSSVAGLPAASVSPRHGTVLPAIDRFAMIEWRCPAVHAAACCQRPPHSRSPLRRSNWHRRWSSCSWTALSSCPRCLPPPRSGGPSGWRQPSPKRPHGWKASPSGWIFQAGSAAELLPWLSAAEMLTYWPERLEEFLGVFQQVAKHRTTSTGISRRFGLLLREAAHLEEIGYATPADALRDYLLRHYAAGHLSGKVCLFQGHAQSLGHSPSGPGSPRPRPLVSCGFAVRTIASLVARGILVGQIHPAGEHGRSVGLVLRQSVESLQIRLAKRPGRLRHGTQLGHRTPCGPGPHPCGLASPCRPDGQRLADSPAIGPQLEALCTGLPRIKGESAGWISLRQATRIAGPSGLALSQLLKLIQAGSLQARMAEPQKGLNGIVVSQADLAAAQRASRDQGDPSSDWSLHRAARMPVSRAAGKVPCSQAMDSSADCSGLPAGRRTMISADGDHALPRRVLPGTGRNSDPWDQPSDSLPLGGARTHPPVYGKRVTPRAGFSLYRRRICDDSSTPLVATAWHDARLPPHRSARILVNRPGTVQGGCRFHPAALFCRRRSLNKRRA